MKIINYKPEYAKHFDTLNRAWVEKYFYVEPIDDYVLTHPQEAILDKGGRILFAEHNNEIIGAIAMVPLSETEMELTKMGVEEQYQGLGAGKLLFSSAIDTIREMGYQKAIIYSNTKLSPAISLYYKHGFVEIPIEAGVHYDRCNIKMELVF
jgi:GNAT superfamily N-acetyltransferase